METAIFIRLCHMYMYLIIQSIYQLCLQNANIPVNLVKLNRVKYMIYSHRRKN